MQFGKAPPPPFEWPNGAHVCVSVTVGFEAYRYHGHLSTKTRKPNTPDMLSLSYASYGYKVGAWRIMDVLERNDMRACFDVNGLAAERYPELVGAMHQRGHETAGHGYANDTPPAADDPDAELRDLRATIAAIEKATGERPQGWVGPGSLGTERTLEYMVDEGFLWNGDDASDDVPYVREVKGKKLVILPRVNFSTNDLIVWMRPANPPSAYFEGVKEAFDFCYSDGKRGFPKWVDMILHMDIGSRPGLIGVFERAIQYCKQHDNVWFARRRDIAQWTLEKFGEKRLVRHEEVGEAN